MRRRNFLRLGSGEAIGGALAACGADPLPIAARPAPRTGAAAEAETETGIVRGWNALALRAIRATQPGLPQATRALALLHTCMYNAWAAYDDDARQTVHGRAVRLPRAERSAASKAGAMSHAAHLVLCERFAAQRAGFDARMAALGLAPARPAGQFTPAGIGRTQATAMLEAWRGDGADEAEGLVTVLPFALPCTLATPHAALDHPVEPEAGLAHAWCGLAQRVSQRDGHDDDRDVLLYFVLAHALADAVIAAADAAADRAASHGIVDAAAAGVLRSFTGSAAWRVEAMDRDVRELGRQVGARVFEKARRCWRGRS